MSQVQLIQNLTKITVGTLILFNTIVISIKEWDSMIISLM